MPMATVLPPIADARDAIQLLLQGPGAAAFLLEHRARLQRVFLYWANARNTLDGMPRIISKEEEEAPGDITMARALPLPSSPRPART